jgi:hypothetical protein
MFYNSNMQQQMQMQASRSPGRLRSKFTVEEDARLRGLVQGQPNSSWQDIAEFFPGKTIRQVRERYKNYLSPHLNHFPWSGAEDELLREKFAIHGPKWRILKQFFVNRSDVNIKNRWSVLVSQAQRHQFGVTNHPIVDRAVQSVESGNHETIFLECREATRTVGFENDVSENGANENGNGSRRASIEFEFIDAFAFDPFDSFCTDFGFGQY